jgi:hypothetical protein
MSSTGSAASEEPPRLTTAASLTSTPEIGTSPAPREDQYDLLRDRVASADYPAFAVSRARWTRPRGSPSPSSAQPRVRRDPPSPGRKPADGRGCAVAPRLLEASACASTPPDSSRSCAGVSRPASISRGTLSRWPSWLSLRFTLHDAAACDTRITSRGGRPSSDFPFGGARPPPTTIGAWRRCLRASSEVGRPKLDLTSEAPAHPCWGRPLSGEGRR